MLEMMVERSLFEPNLLNAGSRGSVKLSKKYLESTSPRLDLSNYVAQRPPIIHLNHTPTCLILSCI